MKPESRMTPDIRRLSLPEFTAMLAMLFATVAFSIDAMLPGLPQIAAELTPRDVNRAQLVISTFVLGMGVGTAVAGPISDAYGRRGTIIGGFVLYITGALLAHFAPTMELLLAARLLQGLGSAGPRIVGLAMVRDLYAGRDMARVSSFVMMVFMIVPALAPSVGALIMGYAGWRAIFIAFMIFAVTSCAWLLIRQPETLPVAARRPLSVRMLWDGTREVLRDRTTMICTLVMTLAFGQMMGLLSSIQQLYADTYDQAANFPKWFGLSAILSSSASLVNAKLVMRLGMVRMVRSSLGVMTVFTAIMAAIIGSGQLGGWPAFAAFFLWATSIFFMAGLIFGNLNAIAMQNMGHLAGMTASVMMGASTVLAVVIAAPVGLAFNGTALPVMIGAIVCSGLGWVAMGWLRGEG